MGVVVRLVSVWVGFVIRLARFVLVGLLRFRFLPVVIWLYWPIIILATAYISSI